MEIGEIGSARLAQIEAAARSMIGRHAHGERIAAITSTAATRRRSLPGEYPLPPNELPH
jgi:hypothetical protein